ncbi:MAG: ATP-dependent helicase [Candidatus Heimdallarchaeum endolithica]|uniref:ATP-dependent helicase n=1 Tax=Candidatus Heimdallarchaeum endolithica TaxID=2876572 RepID=A0A9Y1FP03_9ARCH|nr:MAG: ATP-dependent helicase [Candidatus Heimdallarchaeum endolithica]
MITYLLEPSSPEHIFSFLDEIVKEWFSTRFPLGFTPPQLYAIPSIHDKQNTLIFSSTGSGKTFAAFLASINELFLLAKQGELKEQIYVLYISPLKALSNDIKKNLEEPLQGIQDLAASKGISTPKIRVEVRTGDTSQSARNQMRKKPPHILITTPESLGLILTSPKFSEHLKNIRWFILDEIHELANNKRGVLLSLFVEYLTNELAKNDFTRIGLSATQAPIEEIARFLIGVDPEGKERDCAIANLPSSRKFDLKTISPVKDLLHTPYVEIQQSMYAVLSDLILEHETSIIFTNTRRGAENVAFKLKEYLGPDYSSRIAVHHSSISRESRLDVEDKLKNNELLAAVSSTSLELGIDIGSVDLVSQIGSPKSVAKYLQRVGRSGHSLDRVAKGRLIVTDRDDAIECAVLNKSAYANDIDKVQIPENCLDVLAQFIVGISIIKRWNIDEAFKMIKCSYNFRNLSFQEYLDVIKYLGGHYFDLEERKVYRKIWYDEKEKAFSKKKNTRIVFYLNLGTIPENADYFVELETYRTRLGVLSEKFVERLNPGDIFILGSHTYQFKRTVGSRVIVADAFGKRPTVPSWVGEELPRSFELSQQIGRFIKVLADKIKNNDKDTTEWILRSFNVDEVIAETIVEYIKEQLDFLNLVPTHDTILIESYVDPKSRLNIIFHSYAGRRVNDALSKAFAFALGKKITADIASAVNDNGFLLTLPAGKMIDINEITELVNSENLTYLVKKAVVNSELFQLRFRHVANRAFMILRHSGTRSVPVSRQTLYAKRILSTIKEKEDFCVIKETYREILKDYMDLTNALRVLRKIEAGEMNFIVTPLSDIPSPFAHGIVLLGSADIVQISDRTALLRELHSLVLSKVFDKESIKETLFKKELVEQIFNTRSYKDRNLPISSIHHLERAIKNLAPINTLTEENPSIYHLSISDVSQVRSWVFELIEKKHVVVIPLGAGMYRTVHISDFPLFWNIYVVSADLTEKDKALLSLLETDGPLSESELKEKLNLKDEELKINLGRLERSFQIMRVNIHYYRGKLRHKYDISERVVSKFLLKQASLLDPEECLKKVILRFLKNHGPSTISLIANYLQLSNEKIRRSLTELEQQNLVLSGKITEHFLGEQYIRVEDRELLRNLSTREDALFFTPEELNALHYYFLIHNFRNVQLSTIDTKEKILDLIDFFGYIEDINSLVIRINNFSKEDFEQLAQENKIIQGRFSYNRVAYVTSRLFKYYYVAYHQEFKLSHVEELILDTITKFGPLSKSDIVEYTGLDEGLVRESIAILDKTLYLCRKPLIPSSYENTYFQANIYDISSRYLKMNELPSYEESLEFILHQIIRSTGPIDLLRLTQISAFKYSEVEKTIKKLLEKRKIVEKPLSERKTMFYSSDERSPLLPELKKKLIYSTLFPIDEIVFIPRDDPFTKLGLRLHLRDTYGEGKVDPILFNGNPVGSVEYRLFKGRYLQIYDLKIGNEIMFDFIALQKIAIELVNYTRSIHRVLTVQIEDINGKPILSKQNELIKDVFLKAGYQLVKGILIGGETTTRRFSQEVIKKYLLKKLSLSSPSTPLDYNSLVKLVTKFGEISFNEILSRFPDSSPSIISFMLNKLLEEDTIFMLNGFFYSEEFIKYKKAGLRKRKKITEKHKQVHKLIMKGYQTLSDLMGQMQVTAQNLRSILTSLMENCFISAKTIDSSGQTISYKDLSLEINEEKKERMTIITEYICSVVESLGLINEEQVINLIEIPGVLTKARIKDALTRLVSSEKIISGRFIEDNLQLYYMTKSNHERLINFEQEYRKQPILQSDTKSTLFILPPKDKGQFVLSNFFPSQFDKSSNNFIILLSNNIAAQIVGEKIKKKKLILSNVILAPWINDIKNYNYIINALETIHAFGFKDAEGLVIERVNDYNLTALVI